MVSEAGFWSMCPKCVFFRISVTGVGWVGSSPGASCSAGESFWSRKTTFLEFRARFWWFYDGFGPPVHTRFPAVSDHFRVHVTLKMHHMPVHILKGGNLETGADRQLSTAVCEPKGPALHGVR